MLKTDETSTQTESTQDPSELNERELNEVAGGLLPAVGPAAAAPRKTAVDMF